LGLEDTSSTMGIKDYMKNVDRKDNIQYGIWTRSNGAIRVFGT
jgi:hypothetical protein